MSDCETPTFDNFFLHQLDELFRWRRDVRRFKCDPVSSEVLNEVLRVVAFAPSVGLSEPRWFVMVDAPHRREAVRASFTEANVEVLAG